MSETEPTTAAGTTKSCAGPCGRTLPLDAEHFYRQGGGFQRACRDCTKAAARERRAAVGPTRWCPGCVRALPNDDEHFQRDGAGYCVPCAAALTRFIELDDAAERAKAERRAARGDFRDPQFRLDQIRRRLAVASQNKAEVADNCRRMMAAADRAVERVQRPPFDTYELLLLMMDAAEHPDRLAAAVRRTRWTPETEPMALPVEVS